MVDSAMLVRLMNQMGYYKELANGGAETLLPLAKAIWKEAQAEEREACAKVCEEDESGRDGGGYFAGVIRERSNAEITVSPKASPG